MDLFDAATYFDRNPVSDAYTGAVLFEGQLNLYDDSKRDSEAAERRVLSLSPTCVIPSRRTVQVAGQVYLVGKGNADVFLGSVIRVGYVVHEAKYLATVRTLEQLCLNQPGYQAWTNQAWLKNAAFTEQSSELSPMFHLFLAEGEPVADNYTVQFGNELHLVRTSNLGASGVQILTTERLDAPNVETATFGESVYDPVSGNFSGASHSTRVIRLRWQALFEYGNKSAPTFGPDDLQVVVAKASYTPVPGNLITLSDGPVKVQSVRSLGAVWICRVTRVDG